MSILEFGYPLLTFAMPPIVCCSIREVHLPELPASSAASAYSPSASTVASESAAHPTSTPSVSPAAVLDR